MFAHWTTTNQSKPSNLWSQKWAVARVASLFLTNIKICLQRNKERDLTSPECTLGRPSIITRNYTAIAMQLRSLCVQWFSSILLRRSRESWLCFRRCCTLLEFSGLVRVSCIITAIEAAGSRYGLIDWRQKGFRDNDWLVTSARFGRGGGGMLKEGKTCHILGDWHSRLGHVMAWKEMVLP